MTTTDPGVTRALAQVRADAEKLLRSVADAEAALAGDREEEPTARVTEMVVGGWMRRLGSSRWLPIAAITECVAPDCWRIDFGIKSTDVDGTFVHVSEHDAFPFLTAEQFDRDCDREQAAA